MFKCINNDKCCMSNIFILHFYSNDFFKIKLNFFQTIFEIFNNKTHHALVFSIESTNSDYYLLLTNILRIVREDRCKKEIYSHGLPAFTTILHFLNLKCS